MNKYRFRIFMNMVGILAIGCIIGILLIVMGIIFSVSNAGTGKLYTNLADTNLKGIGYSIGKPVDEGKKIWHKHYNNKK